MSDGSRYTGMMRIIYDKRKRKQIQHGNGKLTLKNGQYFEGEWKNGVISEGKIKFACGDKYIGEIDSLMPHGYGEL